MVLSKTKEKQKRPQITTYVCLRPKARVLKRKDVLFTPVSEYSPSTNLIRGKLCSYE